jgi:hypothetical protein
MTYKELAKSISNMTEDQQNCDVTVYVQMLDEFYPIQSFLYSMKVFEFQDKSDVLDEDHPLLVVE